MAKKIIDKRIAPCTPVAFVINFFIVVHHTFWRQYNAPCQTKEGVTISFSYSMSMSVYINNCQPAYSIGHLLSLCMHYTLQQIS